MSFRTLITTADVRTWPNRKDEAVLFLGEWCKRFSKKATWENLDAEVVNYHWNDREKLYSDYKYLQNLYENLLLELSKKLNQIHSVEYSTRYWRIVVGPWLGVFIQILFDRWAMLKYAVENSRIESCIILDREPLSAVPCGMEEFNQLYIEDDWNEFIYGHILEMYFSDHIKINKVPLTKSKEKLDKKLKLKIFYKGKNFARQLIKFLNGFLSNRTRFFFLATYLPIKTELELQLRLGQFPRLWRTSEIPSIKPDFAKRKWNLDFDGRAVDSFDEIVRKFIPLNIPTCYLEGYQVLQNAVRDQHWPKQPEIIFTSNSHSSDDLFKIWAGERVEFGTSLFIGQHGGHFGMTPFSFHEEHQIKIATKWLSWGWSDPLKPQIVAVGNLKNSEQSVSCDPKGVALMVEMGIPRFSYHLFALPVSSQWLDYFEEQKIFLDALPKSLQDQILLKPYPTDFGWDQKERFRQYLPAINIALDHENVPDLIRKSRLYISTYNATTYLESLIWNVPTVIFWNPKHWEIKEDVQPYFDLLKEVGIFHETPESAATHVADIWNNIPVWWESDLVQAARSRFCENFSYKQDNMAAKLEKVFRDL